jgi:glycosyltransferase involved in cell wall biosynthesis
MKVSVVIPAYNEEKNIALTIEAVLAQDYPDFEIIVVDNASTDRTSEIVSKYPVKLVYESRKGLLSARECGRQAATGEIIANIDADCLPEKDWVSRGVAHFAHPGVAAVTGPYDYHDGSRFFRVGSLMTQKHAYFHLSRFLQSKHVKKGAILIGGNNMIRASALEKVGGYTTAIKFYGEDTDTASKISRQGKIVFDRKLHIKTSARRFKDEGTLHLMLKYWYYFFKHIFKHSRG